MNRDAFLLGYIEKISEELPLRGQVDSDFKKLEEANRHWAYAESLPSFLGNPYKQLIFNKVAPPIREAIKNVVIPPASPQMRALSAMTTLFGAPGRALGTAGQAASRLLNVRLPAGSPAPQPKAEGGFPWEVLAIPAALYGGSLLVRNSKKKPVARPITPSGLPTFQRPGEPA